MSTVVIRVSARPSNAWCEFAVWPTVMARRVSAAPWQRVAADRPAARVARWERVHQLHEAGVDPRQSSRDQELARETVRRLVRTPLPPHNIPTAPPRPGGLDSPTLQPYLEYLQDRRKASCDNVAQFNREVVGRGYTGSVLPFARPWPYGARHANQARAVVCTNPTTASASRRFACDRRGSSRARSVRHSIISSASSPRSRAPTTWRLASAWSPPTAMSRL
jgi:hypothetical protein